MKRAWHVVAQYLGYPPGPAARVHPQQWVRQRNFNVRPVFICHLPRPISAGQHQYRGGTHAMLEFLRVRMSAYPMFLLGSMFGILRISSNLWIQRHHPLFLPLSTSSTKQCQRTRWNVPSVTTSSCAWGDLREAHIHSKPRLTKQNRAALDNAM